MTEEQHSRTDGSLPRELIRVQVDARGYMMNGNNIESDTEVVWAGDSIIECANIPQTSRVCSVLERKLNADGHLVAVRNAAYSGATLLHVINVTLNKIVPTHPKVLIVSTGAIDHSACVRRAGFWSSLVYVNPLVGADGALPDEKEPLIPCQMEQRTALLNVLLSLCSNFNIRLFLTTIACKSSDDPWSQRFDKSKCLSQNSEIYKALNASTRAFCANNDCGCIDLERALANRDDLFYDHVHFNVAGSQIVAEAAQRSLGPWLRSREASANSAPGATCAATCS